MVSNQFKIPLRMQLPIDNKILEVYVDYEVGKDAPDKIARELVKEFKPTQPLEFERQVTRRIEEVLTDQVI